MMRAGGVYGLVDATASHGQSEGEVAVASKAESKTETVKKRCENRRKWLVVVG